MAGPSDQGCGAVETVPPYPHRRRRPARLPAPPAPSRTTYAPPASRRQAAARHHPGAPARAPHRPGLPASAGPQAWPATLGCHASRAPLPRHHHGAKEPMRFLRHAMFPTARTTTTITTISQILIPIPPGARNCSQEASDLLGVATQSGRHARTRRLMHQSAKQALPGSGATLPDTAQTALSRDQHGYGNIRRVTADATSGHIGLQ